ncbi:MAG TPA: YihY/virulence factor BrkB family protein [Segeticoccus sp.]|uniref:YihY/virulence factor BrkB family protein n=1 Tax=Segeticoccus sp. TaxID=2706531 RepID=UPI002D7F6B43|nr:YihY/virulence factor BrkB family protein [Segeticoccus sp.]HET8599728.1 YihY/virulence factor BrkB family protein [Segeticoccus sp.]
MSKGESDSRARGVTDRADDFQQRHSALAVPVAVVRKFGEDKSTNLASMIAFWAFFSLIPLLLLFITLLGFFLPGSTKAQVLKNVARMFPLLDASTVAGLSGSWWALIVGAVSALWSGLAVVRTTQFAFNSVWEVPRSDQPKLVEQIGRSVAVLTAIGGGLVLSTLITGFVSGASASLGLGLLGRIVGFAIAILLDVGLFIAAFRLLTDRDVTVRDVLPGAVLSGLVFWVLQSLSSFIISRHLHSAQGTYGNFATVITILWWFYLQSIVTLLGAQLNVVLAERLHPRGLVNAPKTDADQRAYQAYAEERKYHAEEEVRTDFSNDGRDDT